jgi:hypothetical protein
MFQLSFIRFRCRRRVNSSRELQCQVISQAAVFQRFCAPKKARRCSASTFTTLSSATFANAWQRVQAWRCGKWCKWHLKLQAPSIAAAAGIAVDTAQSYLDACESAYLIFGCQYFAYSERKRAAYNKKYYPIDTALRGIAVSKTGNDVGKLLECATYVALRRKYDRVFYWRGKGEVDFVVQAPTGEVTPYQVSLKAPEERHHRALEDFYEHFPHAQEAVFVTLKNFAEVSAG